MLLFCKSARITYSFFVEVDGRFFGCGGVFEFDCGIRSLVRNYALFTELDFVREAVFSVELVGGFVELI